MAATDVAARLREMATQARTAREVLGGGCPPVAAGLYPEHTDALAALVEAAAWMRRYGSFDHCDDCAITGPCTCGYDEEARAFGSVDTALAALDAALKGED